MVPAGIALVDVTTAVTPVARTIMHVDLDAFYASVEQRDRPELTGRPLIVGGPPKSRSVVCAASYEARAFGVRSAMPCAQAARLCPDAVFLVPDFPRYQAASERIRGIFSCYTTLVEPLSLDEAYLDITGGQRGLEHATALAGEIRARIRAETGLTATAGIGPNKFIAKAASDRGKPDGLVTIAPDVVRDFVAALPIQSLPGIGSVTAGRCHAVGVHLVADLIARDDAVLARLFGNRAPVMRQLAVGIDERPVVAERARRSLGIERTFAQDMLSIDALRAQLGLLCVGLHERMQAHHVLARSICVTVKYHDFRAVTRSRTVREASADLPTISALAAQAFDLHGVPATPVRLLGLTAGHLTETDGAEQLRLF